MINITRIMNPVDRVEDLREPLFVGEAYAHTFTIMPMKDVSFAEANTSARFIRSDGQEESPLSMVDDETNNIVVILTPECYAVEGMFSMYVFAEMASETVCVYSCRGTVLPTT